MNNYICEICNYKTTDSGNFCKHKKSKKHKQNVLLASNGLAGVSHSLANRLPVKQPKRRPDKHICNLCNMEFAHKSSLSKHKHRCADKKLIDKDIENKNKLIFQENKFLKEKVTDFEKMVKTLMDTMNETVKSKEDITSLTSALYGPLKKNPPLKQIDHDDFENYIKPKSKLIKEIMACYRDQTLHEFLGNFILYRVKKKNLHEQSIFSSDTSRQTYYIKELILKNKSIWVLDKQGTRVKKILVQPITNYLLEIVDHFYTKQHHDFDNMDIIEKEIFIRERADLLKLSIQVQNGKLDERINKFICPHLQIDLDKLKTLKQETKVPTLDFDNKQKREIIESNLSSDSENRY
mgnify:FL=1